MSVFKSICMYRRCIVSIRCAILSGKFLYPLGKYISFCMLWPRYLTKTNSSIRKESHTAAQVSVDHHRAGMAGQRAWRGDGVCGRGCNVFPGERECEMDSGAGAALKCPLVELCFCWVIATSSRFQGPQHSAAVGESVHETGACWGHQRKVIRGSPKSFIPWGFPPPFKTCAPVAGAGGRAEHSEQLSLLCCKLCSYSSLGDAVVPLSSHYTLQDALTGTDRHKYPPLKKTIVGKVGRWIFLPHMPIFPM